MREKTNVNDVDRSMYDFRNEEKDVYRVKEGLTPAIVEKISSEKHDPVWMQNFRLESLQIYNEMKVPDWGPSIEGLNMDDIVTYVRPNTKILRIHLKNLVFLRQKENHLPGLVHSMTQNLYTTMSVKKLQHRGLYTQIWKVH